MIDDRELRKRNLVKIPVVGEVSILELRSDRAYLHKTYETGTNAEFVFSYDDIEPIPLTPELLERFGFRQNDNSDNWWNKEMDCSIDVEPTIQPNAIELLFYYRISSDRRIHIMYAHKLQNLHYECKGEELILKP